MGSGISREVLPERLDEESFMAVSKIMLSDIFHKKKDKDGHLTKEQVLDFLKALSLFTTGDFPSTNFERESPPVRSTGIEVEKARDFKEVSPINEAPPSPRMNNLFPSEGKIPDSIKVVDIEQQEKPSTAVSSPTKKSSRASSPSKRRKEKDNIRFVEFEAFKSHGSFPRYPDDRKLTTSWEKIDRQSSITVFLSYVWLRKATVQDPSQQHPDNATNDMFKLCVEGITKLVASLAPGMEKCYIWADYSCLNQDLDMLDEMQPFDRIMSCCDCIFTPLCSISPETSPAMSTTLTLSDTTTTAATASNLSSDDYFAREFSSVSSPEANQYLNNSWCRLHMLYGATVPIFDPSKSTDDKGRIIPDSSRDYSAYYVDFDGDSPADLRAAKFSPGLRIHMLCGRRAHLTYSQNESTLGRIPKILPLFHFLFYERYDPEQGELVSIALELPALKKLVLDLAPYVVFPAIGYDGEYDSEDGSVNGQGRYVYEDGSIYTGAFKNGKKHGQGYLLYSNGCMYAGNYKDDHMHGYGIYKYSSGDVYAGKYVEDRKNGAGVYYYTNGDTYTGSLKDGKMNGSGVFRYTNGDLYEGAFKNDLKDGFGQLKYHSGAVFSGMYLEDKRFGRGVYKYTSGDIYDGDWKDGVMSGEGTFKYQNGDVYQGSFLNDRKHGKGVFTYKNGDVYEGEYKDNKKNGKGVYKYISGVLYDGEFKDNKKNGKGFIRYAGGDHYTGDWKDGKRNGKGTLTRLNGDVYEGEFSADQKSGHGIMKYAASGDVFEGSFLNDRKHGKGVYTYSNGYSYEGQWKEGNTVSESAD